jgi:hypothetical protein
LRPVVWIRNNLTGRPAFTLTEDEAKTKSADFLHDDLEHRIAAGDVRFDVIALLDAPATPPWT